MVNNIPDNLVEKIKKLLRLAESSNHAGEMELAMQKAKALAVQYEIDLNTINLEGEKKVEPIEKGNPINIGRREPVAQKFVNWILQTHFNVRLVHFKSRQHGSQTTMIGRKSDLEIAEYLHGFLNKEFMRLWHNYRYNSSGVSTKDRNSFLYGIYKGLDSKLTDAQKNTETEVFNNMVTTGTPEIKVNEVKQCYALAKVSLQENLRNKLEEFYPDLRKAPKKRLVVNSCSALQAGFQAGQQISLRRGIAGVNQSALDL